MKTVAKIIELFGGLEWLREPGNYIRLDNPPHMRLVIEHIGEGPRGMPAVSVAHYYLQNGDAMRDPEIVFEVSPDALKAGIWNPVSFRQDNVGIYQEAVFMDDDERVMILPKLVRELKTFAREWDNNIARQGFLKAARSQEGAR